MGYGCDCVQCERWHAHWENRRREVSKKCSECGYEPAGPGNCAICGGKRTMKPVDPPELETLRAENADLREKLAGTASNMVNTVKASEKLLDALDALYVKNADLRERVGELQDAQTEMSRVVLMAQSFCTACEHSTEPGTCLDCPLYLVTGGP